MHKSFLFYTVYYMNLHIINDFAPLPAVAIRRGRKDHPEIMLGSLSE